MTKRFPRRPVASALGLCLLILGFQNCAKMSAIDLRGQTTQASSTGACYFNQVRVENSKSIRAYKSPTAVNGSCVAEDRICAGGSLTGSFPNSNCTGDSSIPDPTLPPGQTPTQLPTNAGPTCKFKDRVLADGATVTVYAAEHVDFDQACVAQTRICRGGVLSGQGTAESCSVPFPEFVGWPASELSMRQPNLKILTGATNSVYVASQCGIFQSTDAGANFKPVDLGSDAASYFAHPTYVDGTNLYTTTSLGIFVKRGAAAPAQIFDRVAYRAALDSATVECSRISLGRTMAVRAIYAAGDFILIAVDGSILTSSNGGLTWRPSKMLSGGNAIAGPMVASFSVSGNKIYAAHHQGNTAGAGKVLTPQGDCIAGTGTPHYGLSVSTDGGASFNSLPVAGGTVHQVTARGDDVFIYGTKDQSNSSTGWGLYASHDGGQSFSKMLAPAELSQRNVTKLAFAGPDIFAILQVDPPISGPYAYQTTEALMRSADGGRTFTPVAIDATVGQPALRPASLAVKDDSLYVLTDRGVYVSRDRGVTFPIKKRFSSNVCTYDVYGYTSGLVSDGGKLLGGLGFNLLSSPDARSFRFHVNAGSVLTRDLFSVGSQMLAGQGFQMGYQIFGADLSIRNITPDPLYRLPTGAFARQLPGTPGSYVSADGADLLPQVPYADFIVSAYSNAGRIAAARWGEGLVVVENGSVVWENKALNIFALRAIDDVIFAIGYDFWASYDQGRSFAKVPFFGLGDLNVFKLNGKFYAVVNSNGSRTFVSTDGGRNFKFEFGSLN